MDIELVRNFRKLINTNFNELIVSVIEQYNTEIDRLNEVIVSSTALVKEKEDLISELQKELEDTKFDEDNFNNVSLIHNLNKQVEELTSQNKLLNTSLERRRKNDKLKAEQKNKVEEEVVANENNVDADAVGTSTDNNNEDADAVATGTSTDNNNEDAPEDNDVVNTNQEDEEDNGSDEETVEVEEIEVDDKSYYVKDNKIYNKKKNGDMGNKVVGEMIDGEPVIKKKDKKDKKDKKNKKKKNNE